MSIMDIFKNVMAAPAAPAPAPAAPAAPTPGNIPANTAQAAATANTAGTAPNGTIPAGAAATATGSQSGLDAFADIWNTEAKEGESGQPLFNVSQEKMMEAARKQSFMPEISAEQQTALQAGGAGATQVMLELMNSMAQATYAQSAFAGTRLIEGALNKSQFAKSADIERTIKASTLNSNLRQENPIFAHPAAQPLLASVQAQMVTKYPNATPAELTKLSQDYLTQFVAMANGPQAAQQQAASTPKADDWEAYFR